MKKGRPILFKIPINKDRFMDILKQNKTSIRKLGDVPEIGRNEKTIRRYLEQEEMPYKLLMDISNHIGVEPICFVNENKLKDKAMDLIIECEIARSLLEMFDKFEDEDNENMSL